MWTAPYRRFEKRQPIKSIFFFLFKVGSTLVGWLLSSLSFVSDRIIFIWFKDNRSYLFLTVGFLRVIILAPIIFLSRKFMLNLGKLVSPVFSCQLFLCLFCFCFWLLLSFISDQKTILTCSWLLAARKLGSANFFPVSVSRSLSTRKSSSSQLILISAQEQPSNHPTIQPS